MVPIEMSFDVVIEKRGDQWVYSIWRVVNGARTFFGDKVLTPTEVEAMGLEDVSGFSIGDESR